MRNGDNSDDAIAAQFLKFVFGDAKALQDFCGVFADVGDMGWNFVAAQA
jgi:hypothetical protein